MSGTEAVQTQSPLAAVSSAMVSLHSSSSGAARRGRAATTQIVGREVWSFASATDAHNAVVTEIFHFRPRDGA